MALLETNIQYAKGVGEKRAKLFARVGIHTFEDMLRYFPRDYEDRTKIVPISALENGVPSGFAAEVIEPVHCSRIRDGLDICKTKVADEDGSVLDLVFFNAPYVKNALHENTRYVFYGRPMMGMQRLSVQNPVFEEFSKAGRVTGRILPVYRLTNGLTHQLIRTVAGQVLTQCQTEYPTLLSPEMEARQGLCSASFAYQRIHFPQNHEEIHTARRRLVFEELLVLQLGLQTIKQRSVGRAGKLISETELTEFFQALPFRLTDAQNQALQDIARDLQSGFVMNRLVQGDVGSGKTVIAAGAAYMVCRAGFQAAMMAPTALLAEQHFQELQPLLEKFEIRTGLLTGAMSAKERKKTLSMLASGELFFVIGTHALFSGDVVFYNLALCITDEQHRFGVVQRQLLAQKGGEAHKLVMSATPIPRTLAHIMYGDLDLSVMNEMPPGRKKVDTFVVDETYRGRIEKFIRKQVEEGRQVFIVCPLIEDENDTGLQAADDYAKHLQTEIFPDFQVGVVHGKQKPRQQEAVMRSFVEGTLQILVSTTVIEVGVNVPNATLMIVENAERFGLSQLHQLRGRVGRGEAKSYCILFLQTKGEKARARLEALRSSNDGFFIAEQDLALRGPGDFFGERQHGLPVFDIADLSEDTVVLGQTRQEAQRLMEEDPELSACPALRKAVQKLEAKLS